MLRCGCGLRMDRTLVRSWNIRLKVLKPLRHRGLAPLMMREGIDMGSSIPRNPANEPGGGKANPLQHNKCYESSGKPKRLL